MLLSDVLDTLAYGELSALALANDGEIDKRDLPKLVNVINRGIADLHKRFMLKRGSLPIVQVPNSVRYTLNAPDLIEVIGILAHDTSVTAPQDYEIVQINHPKYLNPDVPLCYLMLAPSVVRFNHALNPTIEYTVDYKAGHIPIRVDDFETLDPTKVELDLPMTYLEALSLFVASKVIAPIDNGLGNPQEGTNYRAMYEQACRDLDVQGLDIMETVQEVERFKRNGFV